MFFSSSWSWKIIYYLLCILMNDNYRTRTVCLTFTAQCCCKICPLTADSPLPGSACVLQYFHFAELHTSARLHLKRQILSFLFRSIYPTASVASFFSDFTPFLPSENKVSPDVLNVCDEVWKMHRQESWAHTLWYIFEYGGVGISSFTSEISRLLPPLLLSMED